MNTKETPNLGDSNSTKDVKEKTILISCKSFLVNWFNELSQKSSLQGFQYMTMKRLTIIEKIFWIITFLVSIVLSYFFILEVWVKWTTSPVIVSFSEQLVPVGKVPFPSVTICPMRKVLREKYNFTREYQNYIDVLEALVNEGKANASVIRQIENLENIGLVCDLGFLYTVLDRKKGNRTMIDDFVKVAPFINNVFYECVWRGKKFKCSELFTYVLTWEGLCFNFNSLPYKELFNNETNVVYTVYNGLITDQPSTGWSFEKGYDDKELNPYPRRGREPGGFPDLEIILKDNLEDRDPMCNSMEHGFKLYLQHPADVPTTSLFYYPVQPDALMSMAITVNMISSSDSLQGYSADIRQCYFPHERKLRHYKHYTMSNCQLECHNNHTYDTCKCVWHNMPFNDTEHYCSLNSTKCYLHAKEKLANMEMRERVKGACHCLPPCQSIDYDAEVVKTDFDLKTFLFNSKRINNVTDNVKNKSIKYSRVEMYFKNPRFVSMRRSELFGLTDFLANCGGLLGLFLGFSFLSVVEILYFMTIRLFCMLRHNTVAETEEKKDKLCHCECNKNKF